MNTPLTDRDFWRRFWREKSIGWCSASDGFVPEWHGMVSQRLAPLRGTNCIEIGCFPGRYMHYFARTYGMTVSGVDFVESDEAFPFEVHNVDFLDFDTSKRYGLVCSFGFVEHFDDIAMVVSKHLELLDDNGVVLITVPNMVDGWRYAWRRAFDREMFRTHNRHAMTREHIADALSGLGCAEVAISEVKFSDRGFGNRSLSERLILGWAGRLLKWAPRVDAGLASELLIFVRR